MNGVQEFLILTFLAAIWIRPQWFEESTRELGPALLGLELQLVLASIPVYFLAKLLHARAGVGAWIMVGIVVAYPTYEVLSAALRKGDVTWVIALALLAKDKVRYFLQPDSKAPDGKRFASHIFLTFAFMMITFYTFVSMQKPSAIEFEGSVLLSTDQQRALTGAIVYFFLSMLAKAWDWQVMFEPPEQPGN